MAAIDMKGKTIGHVFVLNRCGSNASGQATWNCMCIACGGDFTTDGASLRSGRTASCGCITRGTFGKRTTKHGKSTTRTYRIWCGMRRRCEDTKGRKAHLYALKGITYCDRWKSFEAFLQDMGEAPAGMSLDRIDGDLGYSKENCRWATAREQGNNTIAVREISHNGKTQSVSMWARDLGIKQNTLLYRLRRGWPVAIALSTQVEQ